MILNETFKQNCLYYYVFRTLLFMNKHVQTCDAAAAPRGGFWQPQTPGGSDRRWCLSRRGRVNKLGGAEDDDARAVLTVDGALDAEDEARDGAAVAPVYAETTNFVTFCLCDHWIKTVFEPCILAFNYLNKYKYIFQICKKKKSEFSFEKTSDISRILNFGKKIINKKRPI